MILIQARSTSTRFPGKIMEKIGPWTLLEWVYKRLQPLQIPIAFVVPEGDACIPFMKEQLWRYYEGSEENVLDRYYKAASKFKAEGVVRITADCPFIDPGKVLSVYLTGYQQGFDFVSNCYNQQVDGHEAEWIGKNLLEKTWLTAKSQEDKEHVTTWIKRSPGEFGFKYFMFPADFTAGLVGKLSVDTPDDLERLRDIYKQMEDYNVRV